MDDLPYKGLLVIGDPHLASRVPGFRKDAYPQTILAKLERSLRYAETHSLLPLLLGDLFHWPRDNANWLLGSLMELFHRPILAIAGNHDCAENHLTEDDSLMVLQKAGKVTLLDSEHPFCGKIHSRNVIIGGSSWSQPLPEAFYPKSHLKDHLVFWLTHHNVSLPGSEMSGGIKPCEIPGIDVVINGHIHCPLEGVQCGTTLWLNPGNISRIKRSDASRKKIPSVLRIDIFLDRWEKRLIKVPHEPFEKVFFDEVRSDSLDLEESLFVKGLAELQARRTESGAGLKAFLQENLSQFSPPVSGEILKLAEEVMQHDGRK